MLLIVNPYSVILDKLVIFMKHTLQYVLNFVHKDSNVIHVLSWREIAYKVPSILKTNFPCSYCTYQT
jgi:deoxycytidylate deaminase